MICTKDLRRLFSQTRSRSPIAPPLKSATDSQPPPMADVADIHNKRPSYPLLDHRASNIRTNKATNTTPNRSPTPTPANCIPKLSVPQCLENTLKPTVNLSRDMTFTEAENWLKGFTAWFKWNSLILDRKCPVTKQVLLENC